jgi:hypothetical protein
MDTVTSFVHALGGHHEERLLNIPAHVMDAEELGVHRRATVALAMAQVWLGHELRHLVGFSEGEGADDQDGLVEDLDKATDAVAAEVPTKEVIREAL